MQKKLSGVEGEKESTAGENKRLVAEIASQKQQLAECERIEKMLSNKLHEKEVGLKAALSEKDRIEQEASKKHSDAQVPAQLSLYTCLYTCIYTCARPYTYPYTSLL